MSTAVVIDGAYFLRRFVHRYPRLDVMNAQHVTAGIYALVIGHLTIRDKANWARQDDLFESELLYRIFFYDCPPLQKRGVLPVSGRSIDWSKTDLAVARTAIHKDLGSARKMALRLGRLNDKFGWRPKQDSVKTWLANPTEFKPCDDDFEIDTVQKGVDMRLGLDVAAMAFKRQVNQIILVAGDADFVPAVKLARREGIDVVLDPMGGTPAKDLVDNVDGICNLPIAE
jgi:uncharacterized LabA/DUF88 family protein